MLSWLYTTLKNAINVYENFKQELHAHKQGRKQQRTSKEDK